jgi:predicted ribosome quality control (RQC) complex YloA/Tae2 family protein
MRTDWLIVRRLGAELDAALRGARIRAAGALFDGRFGLETDRGLVLIDVFGDTPLITLEERPAPLSQGPGWPRAASDALEGLRIARVRARPGDRLLAFDCSARSRFGVASGYRLVAELVPRYGNLVLLKGETVVSAAKSFEAGGKTVRTVKAGEAYGPPPLPENAEERVPRLVAESLALDRVGGGRGVATKLETLLGSDAEAGGPVYVYRDEAGRIVQLHVVRLLQLSELDESEVPALLPLLSEFAAGAVERRSTGSTEAKRTALAARIERRRAALSRERAALERERDETATSDALRRAGELLYTHMNEVPPGAASFVPSGDPKLTIELDPRLDAKGNATAFFRRYKKATARHTHFERRLATLGAAERFAEDLAWEVLRAEPEAIGELAESVDRLEGRGRAKRTPARRAQRRLAPREISIAPDARIFVGRSPQGNADLTFRAARPNDLWFHARGVPGAHVILRIDGGRKAEVTELERAAALAALNSKAHDAEKVEVDFTERKHVRKQRGAAPGLVWYTGARTLLVAPSDADRADDPRLKRTP